MGWKYFFEEVIFEGKLLIYVKSVNNYFCKALQRSDVSPWPVINLVQV